MIATWPQSWESLDPLRDVQMLCVQAIMLIFTLAADTATVSTRLEKGEQRKPSLFVLRDGLLRLSSWLLVAGHVLPDLVEH